MLCYTLRRRLPGDPRLRCVVAIFDHVDGLVCGFDVHHTVSSAHVSCYTWSRRGEKLAVVIGICRCGGGSRADSVQQSRGSLSVEIRLANHEEEDEDDGIRRVHNILYCICNERCSVIWKHVQELISCPLSAMQGLGCARHWLGGLQLLPRHEVAAVIGRKKQRREVRVILLACSVSAVGD